jgi:hypothetical protein
MTPDVQVTLAVFAVLAFLMTSAGFLALVWRISWGVRGFVEAEQRRANVDQELVGMLKDFIQAQREHNDGMESAVSVVGARVTKLDERVARLES